MEHNLNRLSIALLFGLVAVLVTALPNDCAAQISGQVAGLPESPQRPARDTSAPKKGTSRIKGRVLAADGGAPVRRAYVSVASSELAETRTVMTDGEGRYEIGDLPAGTYRVSASKAGFIDGQAGGSAPGDIEKPVRVSDREVVITEDVLLSRACAIAGRVFDEYGDPMPNARVEVMRRELARLAYRFTYEGASGSTDDLGQYRVFGLPPGTYYVAAVDQMPMFSDGEGTDSSGHARTYYPGTANMAAAQPVRVALGHDALDTDITVVVTRTARVSGVVLDGQGRPVATGSLTVLHHVVPGTAVERNFGTSLRADGRFSISNLEPGDYELGASSGGFEPPAQRSDATSPEAGRVRVTVAGSDISGLTIQMSRGASVSGQLVFDGASVPPLQGGRVVIEVAHPNNHSWVPSIVTFDQPQPVRPDSTFSFTGLFGAVVFRPTGLPVGWGLKSVIVNGRDVTDTGVTLEGREQITGAQIVVTDRITRVAGTVADEQGKPAQTVSVTVLPADASRWLDNSRYVAQVLVKDGVFALTALPPGDYFAVALDRSLDRALEASDDLDPRELLRKLGTRFSLAEGEAKSLSLKVARLPDRR